MKTILITGECGFIGTELSKQLKTLSYTVLSFNRSDGDISQCDLLNIYKDIKIERIFHLASKTFVPDSWEYPMEFYQTSVLGTGNVLELCRAKDIPLTYVSAYLYGQPEKLPISENDRVEPNNPYAHSKYLAEELCRFYSKFYNVKINIARPFNIYGKNQNTKFLIPHIIQQALHNETINVQDLSPKRDYIYLDDLISGLIKTIQCKEHFSIYNFGSGVELNVKEIIDIIQKVLGTKKDILSKSIERKHEIMHVIADVSKAKKDLNWTPKFNFEDGIKDILKEIKMQNIPINKGNYSSFETPERIINFDKYKSENWEVEYFKYRKNWSTFPKEKKVNNYPLLIDIELASVCNLKCPMCYTITDEFKNKVNAKLIDFTLFKKIIDEVGGNVPALRLSLRGESTLHPKFIECIQYAKKKGIKEVSTLTNGSKLTLEYFEKIVDAGIDWITLSVDGLDEEYEKIRKPLKFKETLEKIKTMHKYKLDNSLHKPVIKIQSLWPSIKNNPEKFYNTFAPITDLIAFNPLIDYLQKDTDIVYIDDFSCPQLYQRLVVGADGKVMMCSNDEENNHIIGDANIDTIHSIWHGNKLNSIRALHNTKNGYQNLNVCKRCYLPRATETTESSQVNGRKFNILNYVNRKQQVGK